MDARTSKIQNIKTQKIVWTNGCFDLIHPGHIDYLTKASKLGYLIVGITPDEDLRKEKKREPIYSEDQRAFIVNNIKGVKKVLIGRAIDLLKVVRPNIYVKGGDYNLDTMNQKERKFMGKINGEIKFISMIYPNHSDDIISRLK